MEACLARRPKPTGYGRGADHRLPQICCQGKRAPAESGGWLNAIMHFMFTVYILQSDKTRKYYIGYTSNIQQRLVYHNAGKNISTKFGAPWQIVYQENYPTKKAAWLREHQIKSYKGGNAFKKLVE